MLLGVQGCPGGDAHKAEMLPVMRCCWVAPPWGVWDRQTVALYGARDTAHGGEAGSWWRGRAGCAQPPHSATHTGCDGAPWLLLGPILLLGPEPETVQGSGS